MKVAVLSNIFNEHEHKAVENDLTSVGKAVQNALTSFGHGAKFYDVNERTFEKLRKADIDIAFNVCERFNGNGFFEPHVASMLELLDLPYTGSGPLTLATCLNKTRVKEIMMHHGIPTPKYQLFTSRYQKLNPELKFPLFVKPNGMHNSIGIENDAICRDEKDLRKKIAFINKVYNQPALVEEFIEGRELAVGVLGNANPKALPISEYLFVDDEDLNPGDYKILCYDAKWNPNCEKFYVDEWEVIPARVKKSTAKQIQKIAVDLYKILDVRDYGRIDIRLGKDGTPYVLEMNPNPGISADNTLPKAALSLGISYNEMIYQIFCEALRRYDMKVPKNVPELLVKQN